MDLFPHLFILKSGVLQKNKGFNRKTLHKEVIIVGVLIKTQFDGRVEDITRRLCAIDKELAEMAMAPTTSEEDAI
jgi:hypothetical protein